MCDYGGRQVPRSAGKSATWRPRRADGLVPIQVQRPENQKNQWRNSHPKASRLEIQEGSMLQFESEVRKKGQCSSLKAIKQ